MVLILRHDNIVRRKLFGDEIVIGRLPECGMQIGSDVVSRRHARITIDSEGFIRLDDLGSDNGTYINGVRLDTAGWKILNVGDKIHIGPYELELELDRFIAKDATERSP